MSRTHIPAELRRQVRQRARECCEYCLMPESMTFATHPSEERTSEIVWNGISWGKTRRGSK